MSEKKANTVSATISTKNIDSSNEVVTGMIVADKVPILWGFNVHAAIGWGHDIKEHDDGSITGVLEITDDEALDALKHNSKPKLYAAMGGVALESHEQDGVRHITKFKLTSIGITPTPANLHLPPIKFDNE